MRFERSVPLLAIASGLGVAFILLALFVLPSVQDWKHQQIKQTNQLMARFQAVYTETNSTFESLSQIKQQHCDPQLIHTMQRHVLRSAFILDIGFWQEGRLVCATLLGHVSKLVTLNEVPNYVSSQGTHVFLDRKLQHPIFKGIFDEPITLYRGNFTILVDPRKFELIKIPDFESALIFTTSQSSNGHLLLGKHDIWQAGSNDGQHTKPDGYYYQTCSNFLSVCAVSKIYFKDHLLDHLVFYLVALVVSFCLGTLVSSFITHVSRRRSSLTYRVVRGVEQDKFYWRYQPVVSLRDRKVIGCEALSRFEDEQGPLYPDNFIAELRQQQLSSRFTHSMVEEVLSEMEALKELPDGFKVGFNIFPADLVSGATRQLLELESVKKSRFQIVLEIVEDEHISQQQAQPEIASLTAAGVEVAIDDFGTGYSNLAYIHSLNCHYLKIDRSFVSDIDSDGIKASLIPLVMGVADKAKLHVIAEGVENEEQANRLNALQVPYAQGWLFGKPGTAEQLIQKYLSS